jgi:hypothetical protein
MEMESINHLFEGHIGIIARDLAAFLGEHTAGQAIDRLLVGGGHLLALARASDLEGFPRHAV